MTKQSRTALRVHTAFRLPEDLVQRVDALVAEIEKRTGLSVSRAEIVRVALKRLLEAGIDTILKKEEL